MELGEVRVVLVLRAQDTMDVIAGAFADWFEADMVQRWWMGGSGESENSNRRKQRG